MYSLFETSKTVIHIIVSHVGGIHRKYAAATFLICSIGGFNTYTLMQ